MDDQLRWLIDLLNRNGIRYWLDSGTLLGLIRDGALLETDHDIDISCFASETENVLSLRDEFFERDYRMAEEYFDDRLTKCFFDNRDNDAPRSIDFKFFFRQKTYLWSPQVSVSRDRENPREFITYLATEFKNNLIKKRWDALIERGAPVHSYEKPFDQIFDYGTWLYPARYFSSLQQIEIDGTNVSVPGLYQDYLEERYGDWETPQGEWDYWWDDQMLHHLSPEKIRDGDVETIPDPPVKLEFPSLDETITLPDNSDRWLLIKTSGRAYQKIIDSLEQTGGPDVLDVLVMGETGQAANPPTDQSEIITFPGNSFRPENASSHWLEEVKARDYDGAFLLYNNFFDASYAPAEKLFEKLPAEEKYVFDVGGFQKKFNSLSFCLFRLLRKPFGIFSDILLKCIKGLS